MAFLHTESLRVDAILIAALCILSVLFISFFLCSDHATCACYNFEKLNVMVSYGIITNILRNYVIGGDKGIMSQAGGALWGGTSETGESNRRDPSPQATGA